MRLISCLLGSIVFLLFFPMPANSQNSTRDAPPAPSVIAATVKKTSLTDKVEALGTLRANETITVTSTVTETVTAVNFTDGQRVEAGHALVEMASGEEKAQLEQARAVLSEAQQQLDRGKTLSQQGAASQSALDQSLRDYNTANARLYEIQSKLGNYVITAPFSGVVGLRNISVGALLQPGMKITTLDDDSVMKLDFSIPSVFLQSVKTGMPIAAHAREFGDWEFKGTVSSIDSQIDTVTRSIIVRAEIPNEDHVLKPGLLMGVTLFSNQREAIVIPEESIIAEGGDKFVFVIGNDNAVEKRQVHTGTRQPGEIEIVDGLQEGEKIIARGTINVQPGQTVSVIAEETGDKTLSDMLQNKDGEAP